MVGPSRNSPAGQPRGSTGTVPPSVMRVRRAIEDAKLTPSLGESRIPLDSHRADLGVTTINLR